MAFNFRNNYTEVQATIGGQTGDFETIARKDVENSTVVLTWVTASTGTIINFSPISEIVNTWLWDFGDGNTSNDSVPSHTYLNPGIYDIQLITSDGQGCTDTAIKLNYIDVKQVVSNFNYNVSGSCPPVVTAVSYTHLTLPTKA